MVSAAAVALQRPLPHRRPRHRNNLHLSPSPPPTPMCHPPRQCPPPVAERTARQALKTSRWCLAAKAIATAMGSLAKVDLVATGYTSSGAGRRAHALRQPKLAAETPDPVEEELTLLVVEQLVVKESTWCPSSFPCPLSPDGHQAPKGSNIITFARRRVEE